MAIKTNLSWTDQDAKRLHELLKQEDLERVSPKLEAFKQAMRLKIAYGGRGAGAKTWSIASLLVQKAQHEKIRVLCTREIQLSLSESVHRVIRQQVERLSYSGWQITNDIITSPIGSTFHFRGLKDLRASNSIKGFEDVDICWVEEAATVSNESWDILIPTIRKPRSEIWITFNREQERDPVFERFCVIPRDDSIIIPLLPGAADNPWWTDELQKEMEEDFKRDSDLSEHVWNGLPRSQGQKAVMNRSAIRSAMDREIKEPVGPEEIGVDVARFGDDLTVMYRRIGMKVVEKREFSGQDTQRTAREAWDMARRNPQIAIKVDDSGLGGGVSDKLKDLGANVVMVNFGSSANDQGKYTSVADEMWFNFPINEVDIPDDPRLMQELSGRQYEYTSHDQRKIEPKKEFKKRYGKSPDCFIAGTLIMTTKGLKPIEAIKIGDAVITPLGPEKVIKTWESLTRDICSIDFSNGAVLSGKPAHKIFTGSRFVRLDKLQGETIYYLSWKKILLNQIKKLFFIKARNISFKQLVNIINQERIFLERDLFIGESGLKNMEKFQKDSIFTILMGIGETIKLIILNALKAQSIKELMQKIIFRVKNIAGKLRLAVRKLFLKLLNGIGRLKGLPGILCMEKKHGLAGNNQSQFVLNVIPNIYLTRLQEKANALQNAEINFSPTIAGWSQKSAQSVGKSLKLKSLWQKKQSVVALHAEQKCGGEIKVYNLTLEKHNVYYANGILVENCADALLLCFYKPFKKEFNIFFA